LELERAAVERLESLDATKSNLMSMLSHDFRGPLTIAHSYLHGLINRLGPEDRAACEEVVEELQNLERMVDNVMLSLEVDAQTNLTLGLEEFELCEVIATQVHRMQNTSDSHRLCVRADLPRLPITADRVKVQSVMLNLIGNAIKYSPEGGEIEVRVGETDGQAEVSVTDHGIGLTERDAAMIFDKLGRSEAALERGISGHGLGLFICRQIVHAHGGQIYARPTGAGARFTFTLPLEARPA
jgi:signal transduction histidine kinase